MLLSIWTGTNPWVIKEVVSELLKCGENPHLVEKGYGPIDGFGRPKHVYAECTSFEGGGSIFAVLLLAFHVGIYGLGAVISWKTRRVHAKNREGFLLGLCCALQLQVLLLVIPTYAAIDTSSTSAKFLVVSLAMLMANLILLCMVFAPKVLCRRSVMTDVKATTEPDQSLDEYPRFLSTPRHSHSSWNDHPRESIIESNV